jgi:hypothetical protein
VLLRVGVVESRIERNAEGENTSHKGLQKVSLPPEIPLEALG